MRSMIKLGLAAILAAFCGAANAASPATTTFAVTLTIVKDCTVSAQPLNFGSTQGVITANLDQSTNLSLQCTNTTPYTIALNKGTTTGGTVAARLLIGGPTNETIGYQLYTDPARSTPWGDATLGTSTLPGTGTGLAVSIPVYGRVALPAKTPSPGAYADSITVTVTF